MEIFVDLALPGKVYGQKRQTKIYVSSELMGS